MAPRADAAHSILETNAPRLSRGEPLCPARTLPDHGACIPVPSGLEEEEGAPQLEIEQNAHHDRRGHWVSYEHVPKRPDRPSEYRSYRFPIAVQKNQSFVMSGYDLDRPDEAQRRGSMKAVGHGGVDLAAPRGTPIHAIQFEHQLADSEVLFVGELFGTSVVLLHNVREAGIDREYLSLHGHLERAASGLKRGDVVAPGTLIGFVGDSASRGIVHLHYEVRRARDGVKLRELGPGELAHNSRTLACD
ncbi:MAG TPA: M23 family metallopeptidase, partial [Polyangiaceae bacterium]|nr:M23 family metallopeptidase [Polyangiaceae bacterium]